MPDDEDEESEVLYELVATGENTCERCMALAGTQWTEPPSRPHDHCECEIVATGPGDGQARDCGDNEWSFERLADGVTHYGPATDFGWEWGYSVTIDCWDGRSYETEIWVDMGYDRDWPPTVEAFDEMDAYAWSELYDQAEEVAAQVCTPCDPPLVS
jgi:hypothetical protein